MNRPEKIAILKAIQNGMPLQEALPTINISLVEYKQGSYLDVDAHQGEWSKITQVEDYLQQVKAKNPNRLIQLTIIPFEEYERLSAELEKEY